MVAWSMVDLFGGSDARTHVCKLRASERRERRERAVGRRAPVGPRVRAERGVVRTAACERPRRVGRGTRWWGVGCSVGPVVGAGWGGGLLGWSGRRKESEGIVARMVGITHRRRDRRERGESSKGLDCDSASIGIAA